MVDTEKKKKFKFIILFIAIAVVLTGVISIFKPIKMLRIYSDLKSGEYQALYVSQFPLDNYSMEDYQVFFGEKFYPITVSDKTYLELCEVLAISYKCNVNDRFVGLSLNNLHESKLFDKIIEKRIDDKWTFNIECAFAGKVKNDCGKELTALCNLVDDYAYHDNFLIGWMGWQEGIIGNYNNFDDKGLRANQTNDFFLETYILKSDNVLDRCEEFKRSVSSFKNNEYTYPDLTGTTVVYLGDSIIANSVPENSIPALLEQHCGTKSVDLSVGGASCSVRPDGGRDNTFYEQFEQIPFEQLKASKRQIAFVINFGLNDFFNGSPAKGEDEYAYAFALRENIEKIREEIPDARIYIMSPTYVFGPNGIKPEGGINDLKEFRQEAKTTAEEIDAVYVDNYNDVGIDETNYSDCYVDDIHPNAQGRLMYARNLIRYMQGNSKKTL